MTRISIALLLGLTNLAWADEPVEPAAEPAAEPAPPVAAPPAPSPTPPAASVEAATVAPKRAMLWAPWFMSRLYVEIELTSQARMTRREGEDLSELRLDRGEFGGRLQLGKQAAAELRFEAIRSALEGGSLGIDGDSTVFRLRTAQLFGKHDLGDTFRIEGALGFVPDVWLRSVEDNYTVKPLSRTGSERLLGWQPTDLAGVVRVSAGPARGTISIGNGEGPQFPERNTGKTTTAMLEVAPITTSQLRVVLAGVVRDGSVGVASIRDRRFGGGATVVSPRVRGGVEAVFAQGIGDQAAAEGVMLGGWADAQVIDRLYVAARGASLKLSDDGGRISTFGGGIAYEPWLEVSTAPQRGPAGADPGRQRGRLRIWLAVDRVTTSGAAMPLPGADAGDATQLMLIASAIAPFILE